MATLVFLLKGLHTYFWDLGEMLSNTVKLSCSLQNSSINNAQEGPYSDSRTTRSTHITSSAVLHWSTLVTRESLRNSLPRTIAACATSINNEVSSLFLLRLHKQEGRQQASIQIVLGCFNTNLMHFCKLAFTNCFSKFNNYKCRFY